MSPKDVLTQHRNGVQDSIVISFSSYVGEGKYPKTMTSISNEAKKKHKGNRTMAATVKSKEETEDVFYVDIVTEEGTLQSEPDLHRFEAGSTVDAFHSGKRSQTDGFLPKEQQTVHGAVQTAKGEILD